MKRLIVILMLLVASVAWGECHMTYFDTQRDILFIKGWGDNPGGCGVAEYEPPYVWEYHWKYPFRRIVRATTYTWNKEWIKKMRDNPDRFIKRRVCVTNTKGE